MEQESTQINQTVTTDSEKSDEVKLKPKRNRSQSQIEWSRQLGKRSQEYKKLKKDKMSPRPTSAPEVTEVTEVTEVEEVEQIKETKDNTSYLTIFILGGTVVLITGCIYCCKRLKEGKFLPTARSSGPLLKDSERLSKSDSRGQGSNEATGIKVQDKTPRLCNME